MRTTHLIEQKVGLLLEVIEAEESLPVDHQDDVSETGYTESQLKHK
jgi:hypothetical protein